MKQNNITKNISAGLAILLGYQMIILPEKIYSTYWSQLSYTNVCV